MCTILLSLCYVQTLTYPFLIWDDISLIVQNANIHSLSLQTFLEICTTYEPELYAPLSLFTLQINYLISALNPWSYHLLNLILHVSNVILVAMCCSWIMKNKWIGMLIGLIWAVHPIHTEVVIWASARKDVLAGFFFLSSLLSYLHYTEYNRRHWYWITALLFIGALLSKVHVALLPLLLLMIDQMQHRNDLRQSIKEKKVLIVLAIFFVAIALKGKAGTVESIDWTQKMLLIIQAYADTFKRILIPYDLSAIHAYTPPSLVEWMRNVLILIILSTGILQYKRYPLITFGILWFIIMLVPSLADQHLHGSAHVTFDRHAYLPSIGIITALVVIIYKGIQRWHVKNVISLPLLGVCAIGLILMTINQSKVWSSNVALFTNVIETYPHSALGHESLANAYMQESKPKKALVQYTHAITLEPDSPRILTNMGTAYAKLGEFEKEREMYERALQIDSGYEPALRNMQFVEGS